MRLSDPVVRKSTLEHAPPPQDYKFILNIVYLSLIGGPN